MMIRLHHVNKLYETANDNDYALKDINLEIKAGTIFGVIGKSGAGKSTLLRSINLLERPTSGQVFIGNEELTALPSPKLREERRKIGMIFQHFNLLESKTAGQNIALPMQIAKLPAAHIKKRVTKLLDLVGLSDKYHFYPAQLSGGQKQRIAIARALATEPSVLLSDEATSALDPETTIAILDLLKDINQRLGLTILLIAHQMEVIKQICDNVAVLDQGQIIEQAEIHHFFARPQTEIAKSLVKACLKKDLPAILQEKISTTPLANGNIILRIFFHGTSSSQPIISHLVKTLQVEINILQANLEIIHQDIIGIMIIEVIAHQERIDAAIAYLKQHDISVEVVGYVARII